MRNRGNKLFSETKEKNDIQILGMNANIDRFSSN